MVRSLYRTFSPVIYHTDKTPSIRPLHGLPIYNLLAALLSARCLLWNRQRLSLLSLSIITIYLLLQEAVPRNRNRSGWFGDWGDDFSCHGGATASKSRISLDDASTGLHPARLLDHLQHRDQTTYSTAEVWCIGRLGEFQGGTLRIFRGWDVLCMHFSSLSFQLQPNSHHMPSTETETNHEHQLTTSQNFWGVYFAFYYLASFSRSIIGLSYPSSVNLLITLNGVGVIGRILPNFLADRYSGPLNTLIPFVLVTAVLSFSWIAVNSVGGLYAWSIVYGIVGAAIQSLFPATLSSLTTNLRMQGTRMGMVFTIVSFAVLTGPPIAGQLIQRDGGGYEYAQIFSGSVMLVGCAFLVAAKVSKNRTLRVKM